MDREEIAEAVCPSCSPDAPRAHVILKKGGLVKCGECGYVHAVPLKKRKTIKLRVIVSRQRQSSVQEIEVAEDDVIRVGDEFVVEHDDEVSGVEVQSIEMKTQARPEMAVARDIDALWARAIDEVVVKIAAQRGAITESVNYKVSGDHEFAVGGTIRLKDHEVVITSIKTRDGGHYKREGQIVKAKDIKRVYSKILAGPGRSGGRSGGFRQRSTRAYRGTSGDER